MPTTYNAILRQAGGEWIGWIEEIPEIHAHVTTPEALHALLRERLIAALANRQVLPQSDEARLAAEDNDIEDDLFTDYIIMRDFLP